MGLIMGLICVDEKNVRGRYRRDRIWILMVGWKRDRVVENKRPGGRYVRLMVAWKMMRGRGLQRLEEGDIRIWATVVYHNNVFTLPLVFHGPHTGDRRDRIVNWFSRSPPPQK